MINVEGKLYKVTENMGFNQSVGRNCKIVQTKDGEKMAVKSGKIWLFWTPQNRFGRQIPPE